MSDNIAMIEGWGGFPANSPFTGVAVWPYSPGAPNPWAHLPAPATVRHDKALADAIRRYRERLSGTNANTTPTPANANQERRGRFIRTHSGRKFWPHDPRPEDIFIEDIAWALSRVQRYGGHANDLYSVAEHCVIGARYIVASYGSTPAALAFLLHDATEALGIGDVSSPAKHDMPEYRTIEDKIAEAVQARFGVIYPGDTVDHIDAAISTDEMIALMHGPEEGAPQPLGVNIMNWPPATAYAEFMREFYFLAPTDVINMTSVEWRVAA